MNKPPKIAKGKKAKAVPKKVKKKSVKAVEVPEVFTTPKFDPYAGRHICDKKYKKLVVKFGNGKDCEIDLIDTPMLKYWLTCHLHNRDTVGCGFWTRKSCLALHTNKDAEKNKENHLSPTLINNAIDEIKKISGVEWPVKSVIYYTDSLPQAPPVSKTLSYPEKRKIGFLIIKFLVSLPEAICGTN